MLLCKEFPAKHEVLPQMLSEIAAVVKLHCADEILINRLKVCAEEIIVNVMNYSQAEKISISCVFLAEENTLRFEFVDDGRLYNPLEEVPEVDLDADLDERIIGGLGIFLYTTIMDKLEYDCADGKNHLLAYKKLV